MRTCNHCGEHSSNPDAKLNTLLATLRRKTCQQITTPSLIVPLDCQNEDGERKNIEAVMNDFLARDQELHRVCLLQGDAFTGKTTFMEFLTQKLCDNHPQEDPVIPIYIDMRFIQDVERCVTSVIASLVGAENEEILRLSKFRFLFIFDGYDHVNKGINPLWCTNDLHKWPVGTKAIITCRPQRLRGTNYKVTLAPACDRRQIVEWRVLHMTMDQISTYFSRNHVDTQRWLDSMPELFEIFNTPFLLQVFVDAVASGAVRRDDFYGAIVQAWFGLEEQNLTIITNRDLRDIQTHLTNFAQCLARELFKYNINEYEHKMSDLWEGRWKIDDLFSTENENTCIYRHGCPLRLFDHGRIGFLHPSLMQYFVADVFWNELLSRPSVHLLELWGLRCLNTSHIVLECLVDRLQTRQEKAVAMTSLQWLAGNAEPKTVWKVAFESLTEQSASIASTNIALVLQSLCKRAS